MFNKLFSKNAEIEVFAQYLKWRSVIFAVKGEMVGVSSKQPGQVYGVVADIAFPDPEKTFAVSLTAFASGEASLKSTFGSGITGLGGKEEISLQAKNIILEAQNLLNKTKVVKEFPAVSSKNVFFYLLTTSGVRYHEARMKDLTTRKDPFSDVFHRFSAVKHYADGLMDINRANKQAGK